MFLSIGTIPEGGRACGLGKEALLDNAVVTNIFVLHDREVLPWCNNNIIISMKSYNISCHYILLKQKAIIIKGDNEIRKAFSLVVEL